MSDDNQSVVSGISQVSASNCAMDCPVCSNSLTVKRMFNHIRAKHQGYFFKCTTKTWLQDAEKGQPLKIMWEVKNDFDEIDYVVIYGCLSTNKTFKDVNRALAHFKKDKVALKDHNKQIKDLLKARQRVIELEKKDAKKDPHITKFKSLIENNDSELKEKLLSVLKNNLSICERLVEDSKNILDKTTQRQDYPWEPAQTIEEIHNLYINIQADFVKEGHTVAHLLKMREPIDRIIHIKDIVSMYGLSSACYASIKTERNPEGEFINPDSYCLLGVE